MAYRANIEELCTFLGFTNPIREEDITIAKLIFYDSMNDGSKVNVHEVLASDMNRGGRLFIQSCAPDGQKNVDLILRRGAAERFFAELWDDCTIEKRTLIFGIKHREAVEIVYKQ